MITAVVSTEPGEAAQVAFRKATTITDVFTGEVMKTWIFVMTLCFSRHMCAEIVRDQTVSTGLSSHRKAFESYNGVPGKATIDNG